MTLAVLLFVLPVVGAGLCAISTERAAKWTGFLAAMVTLAVACAFAFEFNAWGTAGVYPNAEGWELFRAFGVSFLIGADTISMVLILLTALLIPCALLVSFSSVTQRQRNFYAQFLLLEGAVMLAFLARDVILFYIGYEFTLVPLFLIVAIWGGTDRRSAAIRLWVFSFVGSVISLVGFIYLGVARANATGEPVSFAISALTSYGQSLPAVEQWWVFLALMGGFAVKVPYFPAHSWLPLAHGEAPTAGSVVLAGVIIKIGQYGALRFALPMAPEGGLALTQAFCMLSVVGIIAMSLVCWVQNDVKRLVAYSSVAHMGLAMLALFAFNSVGMEGSLLYMVNHGLSTAGMFMCIGIMYERYHTKDLDTVGGLMKRMPIWAVFMVFFAMASLALPGLNGFVSEFLCLLGVYSSEAHAGTGYPGILGPGYALLAASALVLGALYILRMLQKFVFGPLREPGHGGHGHGHHAHDQHGHAEIRDLNGREILAMLPLAAACIVIGVYPKPLLHALEPAAAGVLQPYQALLQRDLPGPKAAQSGQAAPAAAEATPVAAATSAAPTAPAAEGIQ
ncbi:MAG: NADH-quinone oxidoreductase subunit M [Phycisphaerales bacterium]